MRCFEVVNLVVTVELVAIPSGSGGAYMVPGWLNVGNLNLPFVKV